MSGYETTSIVETILEVAGNDAGASKGRIKFSGALMLAEADEYLRKMLTIGLVRYDLNTKRYKTTKFGEDFLKSFKQMGYLLSLIER